MIKSLSETKLRDIASHVLENMFSNLYENSLRELNLFEIVKDDYSNYCLTCWDDSIGDYGIIDYVNEFSDKTWGEVEKEICEVANRLWTTRVVDGVDEYLEMIKGEE